MKEKTPKKILLFKLGAIGDVLMTTPLVRQLRQEFPKAKIVYYAGKTASAVLEGNKNLTKLSVFDENIFHKKRFFKALSLRKQIKKEKFDTAFVLDKHWAFGAFIKSCGIPKRIGFDRGGEGKYNTDSIPYLETRHEIKYYLSLLEKLGIKPSDNMQMEIVLSKNDVLAANNFFRKNKIKEKVIGIAAGGGVNPGEKTPIRRYPTEKFMEIIQKLPEEYSIILLGGPDDYELNENIIKFMKRKNLINGAGKKIKDSAALMKKCSLIICSDSGPMHIASAVNTKIISLFGPTNPARKAPLHKESIAIWHDKDIYESSYEIYGKQPPLSKKSKWMKKITANEVLEAVKKLI